MHKLWSAWKKHSHLVYWFFMVLFVVSASVSIIALRHNNQEMIKLRGQLYVADKDNGNVEAALNTLREYVYSHMNTNLSSGGDSIYPPIQLKYTYQRLQAAAQAQTDASNTQLYTDAEYYCQQQDSTDFSGHNRVPCVTQYVTTHGAQAQAISPALYEFDFVSPTWSPDFAGWSLAVSSLLFLLFCASYIIYRREVRR
jgi:hypothetical protein